MKKIPQVSIILPNYNSHRFIKKTIRSVINQNFYSWELIIVDDASNEKTKIISERSQQLANGSISFLKNPETYNSVQEIALEELKQKKIPFIIERPIPNGSEYWKLEDCTL